MTMDLPDASSYVAIEKHSKFGTLEGYLAAYKTSQSLSNHGYVQRACAFNLGAMHISLQNYGEGLDYLKKALPPEGKKDGKSHGDLYFNFGLAHEGLKDRNEAKKYYKKALEEYRSEVTNTQMEADTIHKIGRMYFEEQEFSQADRCLSELIDLYSKMGNFDREIQAKMERASMHLAMKNATKAQELADACLETLKDAKSSTSRENLTAKHYTDLAVIYTQLVSYDKAIDASKKALDILQDQNDPNDMNAKLLCVLYQNLGAVYNFKGEYHLSIEYHEKATEGFAKHNERLFQGHCFTNMGYAYSQLNNMEKAKEYFMHGLQAAREKDDFKSQWQNLEALACIAFHEKSPDRAEEYLKNALAVFPKLKGNDHDWNRLNKKYRDSIEYQIQAKNAKDSPSKKKQPGEGKEGDLYTDSDRGDVKVIRRGSKTKYLKVRRSGTLRRFNKVALGLDPSSSIKERDEEDSKSGSEEESSEHNSEETEEDDDDKTDESENEDKVDRLGREQKAVERLSKRPVSARPPDSYIPHSVMANAVVSDIESGASEQLKVDEEDSNDSDEDSKKVKANMRQYLSQECENETPTQREVQADVHAQAGQSDDSSEESSVEESIPERPHKPPLPSLSPQPTEQNLRTYETVDGDVKEPGYRFPHQRPPRVPKNHSKSGQPVEDVAGSSGIYESIRHTPKPETAQENVKDSDGNELISEEETEKMSRAERDVVLYGQFKQDMKDKKEDDEDDTIEDISMGDQKKSKSCILM